ncbi:MAG: sugar ABC transporter substrate-binding protein, partial [Pseudonocardiales bacterium]|nr:sugar ABC transporter substrate-binding protein [Pseudonocardiales bacterium]
MQATDLAAIAQGDWLVPTTDAARAEIESATTAPFRSVTDHAQWKDQIATPALRCCLADEIDLAALRAELADG